MAPKTIKLSTQRRTAEISFTREDAGDAEAGGVFDISFSSELPVERWFGNEVLSHKSDAAEFGRINDGGVLLFNHDRDRPIGTIEPGSARIEGKVGRAKVRFFADAEGEIWRGRVERGELKTVSFAYQIHDMTEAKKDNVSTFTATRWEPLEISLVTIPADNTVGFGRSDDAGAIDVPVISETAIPATIHQRSQTMDPTEAAAPTANQTTPTNQPANVAAIRSEAAEAERVRVTTLMQLGTRHNLAALADQLIREGASLDIGRAKILEAISGASQTPAAAPGLSPIAVDMSARDQRSYSLARAILQAATPNMKREGIEWEISDEIRRQADLQGIKVGNGLLIPPTLSLPHVGEESALRILGKRGVELVRSINAARPSQGASERATYAVGAAATGGNIVATNLLADSFIEILRNRVIVSTLGARMLTDLVGNVSIPRRNGATAVYWVGEGSGPTQSEGTFDQVTLTPKTVGTLSQMTRLMLLQSTPDIEALVRADILAVMALGIDIAAINGSGASNQPRGVLNTVGIGAVVGGTNGLAPTWSHIVDLETEVATDNADLGSLAYLSNTKVRGKLKKTEKFSSTGKEIWEKGNAAGDGEMNGYRAACSNQVPSNLTKGTSSGVCSAIAFGNWADLLIGMWGALQVDANPFGTGFAAGNIEVRSLQTVDVAVRHPESFSAMVDALTT